MRDYLVDDIYNFHNSWENQLRNQFIGALCLIAWTFAIGGLMFGVLQHFVGLRVPDDVEADGIDKHEHGGYFTNIWNEIFCFENLMDNGHVGVWSKIQLTDYRNEENGYDDELYLIIGIMKA